MVPRGRATISKALLNAGLFCLAEWVFGWHSMNTHSYG